MTDDPQVHEAARSVLDFWFALPSERQFGKDRVLDAEIGDRFGQLRDEVKASGATAWRYRPDPLLAAIILLDQFSRNLFRGRAEAFAADDLAVTLALHGIEMGWEGCYPPERRAFLYMPLMHAEDAPLQRLSVEKFDMLGIEENARFARWHQEVFARFRRFPGRNEALGRTISVEEQRWLDENDGGW